MLPLKIYVVSNCIKLPYNLFTTNKDYNAGGVFRKRKGQLYFEISSSFA